MTHVYSPTFQAVKTAQVLENAALEGQAFVEAQIKLASDAHDAYERIRRAARDCPEGAGLAVKEAMVVGVCKVALDLHDAHAAAGSKIAALPDYLADVLQKLAAAVFVDEVLGEQLTMLEGETKLSAEQCRLLGREYIMTLIGEILK